MIGKKFKEIRTAKGMTQEDIAQSLGVSVFTVQKWEQDKADPNTGTMIKLADLLGASIDYMLGLEDLNASKVNICIELFNGLSEEEQAQAIDYMTFLKHKR